MAQLTQNLVLEFVRHIDRGQQPPYTLNEFRQLCVAWLLHEGHNTPEPPPRFPVSAGDNPSA